MRNVQVLLVDDSVVLQERLVSIIRECEKVTGIRQALNIDEAKSILSNEKVDVLITDIKMPGGNGFELLSFIKQYYNDIKTIMITNYSYPQYRERADQMGAEYFLNKSDELDQLMPILSSQTIL